LRRQYQTVYAKPVGSAAAPTAGLHFTPRLLSQLSTLNFQLEYLTLHVGLGTFKPPTPEQITAGKLHSEWFTLSPAVTARLNAAKAAGRRIIAVGTTTCRVLESCADSSGRLHPRTGDTDIFIKPPYKFKFIDGLLTNFHLPGSSLLMLVSAFASPEIIRRAYAAAIARRYRFYSFGDACLII
jgi:S-adenosylmethionine:tRNA ribosyltransferase-isomerase